MLPRIEFRIPAAPTAAFYNRVHFFCATLHSLGPTRTTDLDRVQRDNPWATQYNLEWHGVPSDSDCFDTDAPTKWRV